MRKRITLWMTVLGIIVLSFVFVGPLCAEVKPIKVLKPYPEYYEYTSKAWYLAGTGLTRVKKPDIPVIGIINKKNVEEYKDMLPPSEYIQIKEWGLELNIIPERFNFKPSKGYIEATKKTQAAGGAKIGPDGSLVNYHGGNPFPDPKTGAEVMWNRKHRYFGDTFWIAFPLSIYDSRGRYRAVAGAAIKYSMVNRTDLPPIPNVTPNPDGVDFRELDCITYPPEVGGTTMMLYRYIKNKADDMWIYIPTMRRIRRFSTGQRCDAYAGSHVTWDNYWIFNGKVQNFDFKLLGLKDMYLSLHQSIHTPQRGDKKYGEWGDPRITTAEGRTDPLPGTLSPKSFKGTFKEIVGSMQNLLVSKRPTYIVEAKSHDPAYVYSKMVFYVDKECMEMTYGEFWDKKGRLWKSTNYPYDLMPEVSPGKGGIIMTVGAWYVDHIGEEGSLGEFDHPGRQNIGLDTKMFTLEGIRKLGH